MLNSLHKTLTSQVGEWNDILAGDFEDVHRYVYIYTHDTVYGIHMWLSFWKLTSQEQVEV